VWRTGRLAEAFVTGSYVAFTAILNQQLPKISAGTVYGGDWFRKSAALYCRRLTPEDWGQIKNLAERAVLFTLNPLASMAGKRRITVS
jgi:hypothetical protein